MRRTAVLVVLVVGIFARTDAADSLNCRLVGRYDLDGFTAIALSGSIAYVSNHYRSLYVLDVSDPTAPFELGRLDATQYLQCVAVLGDLVCLGGDSMSGFLWTVDVSDPREPHAVGQYHFPWGAHIEGGIVLSGHYAYVPVSGYGLSIVSVLKPQSPYEVGRWYGRGSIKDVALSGNLAYVAEYDSGLSVVDVSDLQAPSELGHCSLPGGSLLVAVSGDFAYVAGLDVGGRLRVIDVSNPQEPYPVGWAGFPGTACGLAVSGDFVYVVGRQGLYVMDVSDPPNPHLAGWYVNVKGYGDLVVSGDLAYTPGLNIIEFLGEGVEETPNADVRAVNTMPTVARGVLFLPEAASHKPQAASYLLDAAGRKVAELRTGANDLRALAPGVYFVREEPQATSRKPQVVRKVVVTK
jgi:hypothetical protein